MLGEVIVKKSSIRNRLMDMYIHKSLLLFKELIMSYKWSIW